MSIQLFNRPRPTWVSTRVPAQIKCPKCGGKEAAQFVESPAQLEYQYRCRSCGALVLRSLAELNAGDMQNFV